MRQGKLTAAMICIALISAVSAPFQKSVAAEDKVKPKTETKAQSPQFSDARLKAFASASTEILEVRKKYWPMVQAAGNEEEARKIATTAQGEMMRALAANGLTVDQYNAVVAAAQQDKSLIERIKNLEKGMKTNK